MDSVLSEHDNINKNNHPFSLVQYSAPHKKTFLPLIRGDFGYFWLNLCLILVNFDSFWLILAYFWGIMANFGQNHLKSHAKSNLPGYLYVMNSNFVNTEPIFKIRNSAESYCLAELPFSFPKFPLKIVQNYFFRETSSGPSLGGRGGGFSEVLTRMKPSQNIGH